MKYWVILAFVGIIGSLGTALFFLLKNNDAGNSRSQKMALALGIRVALSIVLFGSLLLAWKLGYLQPTGIASGR